MIKSFVQRIIPFKHYFYHYLFLNVGFYIAFKMYGSATSWEFLLFLIMSFIPIVDEFAFSLSHYFERPSCRDIVNLFLIGSIAEAVYCLHEKRKEFTELVLHNIPVYLSLWIAWYFCLAFGLAVPFYALSAIQTHLLVDILNDEYELADIKKWFWPLASFLPSSRESSRR